MNSKVSIITATYNAERFIEDTIKSVINQTYSNFEMIIVDDCSVDDTINIINRYKELDKRIKVYRLNKNCGAAVARNTAIDLSEGRYIAFLDSDDIWDRDKLEKQISFMKKNNYGFSFTSYRLIDEFGNSKNREIRVPKEIKYDDLLKNTIIGCLTVVLDKEKVGDFKMPLIRAGQDTATWLMILRKGNIAYGYDEVLASYRLVSGSLSSNKLKAFKKMWNIYRNLEEMTIVNSIICMIKYTYNAIQKRVN